MLAQFFRPIIGGEERAVEDLAAALASRGHDVALATSRVPGTPEREQVRGVRVRRLDPFVGHFGRLFSDQERRHLPPLPDPSLTSALARLIAEESPDVVHAHNWIVHSFLPLKRRSGVPLLLSLHDYSLVCATKRMIRAGAVCAGPGRVRCLACAGRHYGVAKGALVAGGLQVSSPWLRSGVDLYLPVSRAVADRLGLERRGLRFEVIPNLLPETDEGPLDDADAELLGRLPAGDFLLFLGDASADKGALVAMQAHALLDEPPPLVFIGRTLAVGARADGRVRALGPWPHRAALAALQRSLAVVSPSIVPETFGLGVLEAMAAAKPVVASRLGGLAELVVDGVSGVLVAPGDPAALAAALRELLADRAALARMGRAAQLRAELYSASRVVPRVEAAYRSVLAAAARTGGEPVLVGH